jgi:hypothetical protein
MQRRVGGSDCQLSSRGEKTMKKGLLVMVAACALASLAVVRVLLPRP